MSDVTLFTQPLISYLISTFVAFVLASMWMAEKRHQAQVKTAAATRRQ